MPYTDHLTMNAMSESRPGLDDFIEPAMPAPHCSRQVAVRWGSRVVTVGGGAPVRVQAMTNTDTVDAIGTAARFGAGGPAGVAIRASDGTLWLADAANNAIRSVDVTSGAVRTAAGGGGSAPAYVDGPAALAFFSSPSGL